MTSTSKKLSLKHGSTTLSDVIGPKFTYSAVAGVHDDTAEHHSFRVPEALRLFHSGRSSPSIDKSEAHAEPSDSTGHCLLCKVVPASLHHHEAQSTSANPMTNRHLSTTFGMDEGEHLGNFLDEATPSTKPQDRHISRHKSRTSISDIPIEKTEHRPHCFLRKYVHRKEYDLFGDVIDTDQFIYDSDISDPASDPGMANNGGMVNNSGMANDPGMVNDVVEDPPSPDDDSPETPRLSHTTLPDTPPSKITPLANDTII